MDVADVATKSFVFRSAPLLLGAVWQNMDGNTEFVTTEFERRTVPHVNQVVSGPEMKAVPRFALKHLIFIGA